MSSQLGIQTFSPPFVRILSQVKEQLTLQFPAPEVPVALSKDLCVTYKLSGTALIKRCQLSRGGFDWG